MNRFNEMPRPIRALFFLFLLIPLASLLFARASLSVSGSQTNSGFVLFFVSYWLLPLLLCFTIFVKRYLFLPLYILQCAILLVHSLGYVHATSGDILFARTILIGMIIYVDILFGNKDLFAPFLTVRKRSWRKYPRSQFHLQLELRSPDEDWSIPAILKNSSLGGMALTVSENDFHRLSVRKKGDRLVAVMRTMGGTSSVPTEIAWITHPPNCLIGLRALDAAMMSGLIMLAQSTEDGAPASTSHLGFLQAKMGEPSFVLWIFFILLVFGLPAFG